MDQEKGGSNDVPDNNKGGKDASGGGSGGKSELSIGGFKLPGLEALMFALVPAIGYGITYAYQVGEAAYYGVPDAFVSPDITNVILSSTLVFVVIGGSVLFGYLIMYLISKQDMVVGRYESLFIEMTIDRVPHEGVRNLFFKVWSWVSRILVFAAKIGFFLLVSYGFFVSINTFERLVPELSLAQAYTVLVFLIIFFAEIYFAYLSFMQYDYRRHGEGKEDFPIKVSRTAGILHGFGMVRRVLIYILLYVPVLSLSLGYFSAYGKSIYYFVEGKDKQVVVQIHGDKLVTASYDEKSKMLEGKFHVIELSDKVELRRERVGQLKMAWREREREEREKAAKASKKADQSAPVDKGQVSKSP